MNGSCGNVDSVQIDKRQAENQRTTKSAKKTKRSASTILFGKVKTNRALLVKYREVFKNNKDGDESFISPRPQPGGYQLHYFALLKFPAETMNRSYFTARTNFKALSEEEYRQELELIKFYWKE